MSDKVMTGKQGYSIPTSLEGTSNPFPPPPHDRLDTRLINDIEPRKLNRHELLMAYIIANDAYIRSEGGTAETNRANDCYEEIMYRIKAGETLVPAARDVKDAYDKCRTWRYMPHVLTRAIRKTINALHETGNL